MSSADNAFSSVAARLIQGGIDAVVAMSASVLVASATLYVEAFYRAIAEGIPAPMAQEQARQALHDEPARHIIRRRRDDEGQPVKLRDWWLPHFYQQRPLVLHATRPSGQLEQQPTSSERLSETMPAEPRYGFSGRAYELLQIERRLMRGQLIVIHLALAGLHPEDAYALASRLLEYLGIDRAKAPYVELRDLLKQLDYHPLAIQLVLPALRDTSLSLAKIKADFAVLLPHFKDDTETGRNGSLLASLDFSLRRLSEEQRALLPRLALFESGASEDDLLAITETPEIEWAKLRPALEQAALITVGQVHENVRVPFLRFHPVLAPYLRSLQGADDEVLRERYAQRYYGLARYLYGEDTRNPQAVRALVRLELPNLRRALDLMLEAGELDDASGMANSVAMFLNAFGLRRELEELRQRVNKTVAAASVQNDRKLTMAEYLRESGLGEDEFERGNLRAAYGRFTRLLECIEVLPEDTQLSRGSYEHCLTIHRLARCLKQGGQPAAAEGRLQEALTIIDILIEQQSDDQEFIRQRSGLLGDLGDILSDLGRYSQAKGVYEEALKVDEQVGDLRNQAVGLGQLGSLALKQRKFAEAQSRYIEALKSFRTLNESESEAIIWHQLGTVAQQQEEWAEAEHCYRESLAIDEQQGDAVGAAKTCNHLAFVAQETGRLVEAEGWWRRALELVEKVSSDSLEQAKYLNHLANLLVNEVRVGHAEPARLNEAQNYAKRAIEIKETLDASAEIWAALKVLANIADLEGRPEDARNYRRRERETYAAFEGNRYHIDRQHGRLIADIVAAAKSDAQSRTKIEAVLPQYEAKGWQIAAATQRIWAGERDWDSLVEGLDNQDALLILRVLETIAQPVEVQNITPEEIFALLPVAIREAMEQGDQAAFDKAFEALSAEEQQVVMEAIQFLQGQSEEGDESVAENGG